MKTLLIYFSTQLALLQLPAHLCVIVKHNIPWGSFAAGTTYQ